jgi:carboxypeptidase Taq
LCAISVLTWDSRIHMPPGGARTRGQQLATLTKLAQERFVGDEMGRLLEAAEADVLGDPPDSYRVRAVQNAREAYDIARRIPMVLLEALAELKAVALQAWIEAKAANDFDHFAPHLAQMITLNQELADAIGYAGHPYDAMLTMYEPEMTSERLQKLFEELKVGILPLLQRIVNSGISVSWEFLTQEYPPQKQRAFGLEIAEAFGYDMNRGWLGEAPHPFEISFTREDVRITTRYQPNYLPGGIFGIFHETGHGLYEQGVDPALTRTALACDFLGLYAVGGVSYGSHESASRLWENPVGRSKAFWHLHFPRLKTYFPTQLAGVDWEQFYRAVNRVQPSLIRVEADEVTYNLHIMLRVEIEMGLLDGSLAVGDLPQVWNAKIEEYLGLIPPTDSQGVLQDMHWSIGSVGSFPAYTIGNIMAAQFLQAALRDVDALEDALAMGNDRPLLDWLTENVYRHGRAFGPKELLMRASGTGLEPTPYLDYLEEKYSDLYSI